MVGFFAFCAVALFEWLRIRRQLTDAARDLADRLSLSEELRRSLEHLASAPADATAIQGVVITATCLGLLVAIIAVCFAAALALKLALGYALPAYAQYRRHTNSLHSFDYRIVTPWALIAIALFALVLAISVLLVYSFRSSSVATMIAWILPPAVLVLSFVLIAATIRVSGARFRMDADAKQEFLLAINHPHRRLRVYADGVAWLLAAWFVTEFLMPWVFTTYQAFPTAVYQRTERILQMRNASAVRAQVLQELRNRSGTPQGADGQIEAADEALKRLLSFGRTFQEGFQAAAYDLDKSSLEAVKEQIASTAAITIAGVLLFAAVSPWGITTFARAGWYGIYRSLPSLRRPLATVIPILPILYLLDRLGVTGSQPVTWILVALAVAVTDTVLLVTDTPGNRRVVVLIGGSRYHRDRNCRALLQARDSKVREVGAREAEVLGLTPCRSCSAAGAAEIA